MIPHTHTLTHTHTHTRLQPRCSIAALPLVLSLCRHHQLPVDVSRPPATPPPLRIEGERRKRNAPPPYLFFLSFSLSFWLSFFLPFWTKRTRPRSAAARSAKIGKRNRSKRRKKKP